MKAKSTPKRKPVLKKALTPSVSTVERLHAVANKLLANPHPFARIEEL